MTGEIEVDARLADPSVWSATLSYGTLTLLFQDNVGGLEVQNKAGEFVPAKPVDETIGEWPDVPFLGCPTQ